MKKHLHFFSLQSLGLHFLGKEAVVADPKGFVASRHAARGSGGDLAHSRHCHTGHHCGHPDLYGPQGKDCIICYPCGEMDPVSM